MGSIRVERTVLGAGLSCLAVACLNAPVHAQDSSPSDNALTKPLTVKFGALFSSKGAVNDDTIDGTSEMLSPEGELGVSYDLARTGTSHPLVLSVYADYAFAPHRTIRIHDVDEFSTVTDGSINTTISGYGAGLSGRYYLEATDRPMFAYVGLGAGLYYERNRAVETATFACLGSSNPFTSHATFTAEADSQTQIGSKFLLGVQYRNGFLVEGSYQNFPDDAPIQLNGLGLMIGQRL